MQRRRGCISLDAESMVREEREERRDHAVETVRHRRNGNAPSWKNQTRGHGRVPGEARVKAQGRPTSPGRSAQGDSLLGRHMAGES